MIPLPSPSLSNLVPPFPSPFPSARDMQVEFHELIDFVHDASSNEATRRHVVKRIEQLSPRGNAIKTPRLPLVHTHPSLPTLCPFLPSHALHTLQLTTLLPPRLPPHRCPLYACLIGIREGLPRGLMDFEESLGIDERRLVAANLTKLKDEL